MAHSEDTLGHVVRLFWRAVLAAHVAAAGAWAWLMPGGFPLDHARFWANRALPALLVALAGAGLVAVWLRRQALFRLLIVPWPALWLAAAVAGRLAFPISARRIWLLPVAAAVVLGIAAWLTWRTRRPSLLAVAALALLGAVVGIVLPIAQRGSDAATRPLNPPFPAAPKAADRPPSPRVVPLADGFGAVGRAAMARVTCGRLTLDVFPLLSFRSRSPDRCWAILARRRLRIGQPWALAASTLEGRALCLHYTGSEQGLIRLSPAADGAPIEIAALSRLQEPVYSHLNSFCEVQVGGHRRLEVAFSPCPQAVVGVLPFDYPVGRPARLACLDADGTFRVIEARSGEKGPFSTLARGRLERGQPLAITLHDQGTPACRIILDDWAAQASTRLSPTAGWGLPQNAIEFSLDANQPDATASFYITLAATSVGRGWDSVGHAPGVYRNRVRIEPLPLQPANGR